ncbi:hypothetical protein Leryth_011598 [Lithospermum erythrorhizon]|uniref:Lyase n=1 Tax=Lithospermum erythrorhizon TaxID=34254 RepID=A0AAV3RP21_LITER|nr:hypothetical protein Leryth_011598 [Lithospermum erythrorhizon]
MAPPNQHTNGITALHLPTKLVPHTTPLDIAAEFSHHDPAFARLNNGSFGCCPSTIISAQKKWQLKFLENPDYFYFNTLQPSILRSRHLIKSLINADDVEEISIVDNVTTGAAIVLSDTTWSFFTGHFNQGDAVLILQKAYGAIKNSVTAYVSRAGGHVIEVPLPFPLTSNEQIIAEFNKALETGKSNGRQKIKLAVIDHVTSIPSVVIPVKELVKICRDAGVEQIFIDGAHGVGCVDVDVKDIGADFYASSLYKWFFCPPAAAFLHCKKTNNNNNNALKLHHPIVSHEYGNGLAAESGWIGTRDYSAQCVIPEVYEFMMSKFEGGIDGIRRRNHEKVVEMAEMLAEEWGTTLGAPPEMFASMVMVGLPPCLGISSDADAWNLFEHLRNCFGILAPVYYRAAMEEDVVPIMITGYVRISHQVYNTFDDYCRLKDAINKLVNDGFTYEATKHLPIINS